MFIENDGVSLHVAEDGVADGPPVLFLHGITSCAETWDWAVPLLADHYRVLRLDFRGHGRSGRAPGEYGFSSYVSDAAAVCHQVIGRPTIVVGHSLGGGTAAALAQQQRGLVTAAFLEEPALMGIDDTIETSALSDGFGLMRQAVPAMQQQGLAPEALAQVLGGLPGSTGAPMAQALTPDALLAMASGLLQVDITVLDPALQGAMAPVYVPTAPIPVPNLVLAADPASPDGVVRALQMERLATYSPLTEVRIVAGAGHLIHDAVAHRQAYAEALLAFVTEAAHVVG